MISEDEEMQKLENFGTNQESRKMKLLLVMLQKVVSCFT